MDIGNILEKLEEDSKVLVITGALSFPIAFIDCWKMSPSFREIDLIPQIILAIGIGIILSIGGIMLNLFYLIIRNIGANLNPFVCLIPIVSTSMSTILFKLSPFRFELIFIGFCFLAMAQASIIRIITHRNKTQSDKKGDNNT